MREITAGERRYIYILKSIAIFCVVCAHLYPVPEDTTTINMAFSDILHYLGTGGVPGFFIVSGFLFAGNTKSFKDFWKTKVISVMIPWFFCYTLLYFYVTIRKGGFSIIGLLQTIFGYYSSAYYLTILMFFYFIFWFIKNETALYAIGGISLFSIICTGWEIGINFLNDWCGTYYLNPLNWGIFFIVGMLLRRADKSIRFVSFKYCPIFVGLSIIYYVVMHIMDESIWYFSKYALIGNVINIGLLFTLAGFLEKYKTDVISEVGKSSYTIYLTNQFLAGLLILITNHIPFTVFTLARPFLLIICIMIAIKILTAFLGDRGKLIYGLLGMGRR